MALSFLGDWANRKTVEAVEAAPNGLAREEVEVVGAVRYRRAVRGQPVVAVAAGVEVIAPAFARRRQKYTVAIELARELASIDSVQGSPFNVAVD